MNPILIRSIVLGLLSVLSVAQHQAVAQPSRPDTSKPLSLSGPRPSAANIAAWKSRRFGMFIHFGLYSELGGVWQGKPVAQGYSEQIMANAHIPRDEYAKLASSFNPTKFDADAIVALAKAAGMKYIVITSKHHDGFNMFATKQSNFNVVQATPYGKDVVKQLSEACARGGLRFGVYYSTIDWHNPTGSPYIEGNSNLISDAHAAFNVSQLKELLTGYGPLSEIWFDMGKPTAAQSRTFAEVVHHLQPATMVSGRVFNYQGDFTVMGDNEVPKFAIDEPWQTPASIFDETWGYRSWQKRGDVNDKIHEKLLELITVVSGGGNYILNIGPEGDGSIVPFEAQVLQGMGTWVKSHDEAIFGTAGEAPASSPFRHLDFGYATLGKSRLYLFVKDLPADGKLSLPGVLPGTHFGQPYLLGHENAVHGRIAETHGGATIDIAGILQPYASEFLPVIVVPFTNSFKVSPAATVAPTSNGEIILTAKTADQFLNYNGHGYEDPATIYKLRWFTSAKPGSYRIAVHYAKPSAASTIALLIGSTRYDIPLEAGTGEGVWTANLPLTAGSTSDGGAARIELTPKEPFYKGTPLPVMIESVALVPADPTRA